MAEDLDKLWEQSKPAEGDDLDALWAKSGPAVAADEQDIGAASTGGVHAARHLAFGLGDKIIAAEMAASDVAHDKTGSVSFGDAYRRNLAFLDKTMATNDRLHPAARWTGNALGVAGNAVALAPAMAAKAGTPLLAKVAQGAKWGGAMGAAGGYGADRSEDAAGTATNMALGAGLGGVIGGAAPWVADKVGGLVNGVVKPTEAAKYLRSKGVDLTVGQMNPTGKLAQLEEVSTSTGGVGPAIQSQRQAARESWQGAVLNEARPPGMAPLDASAPISDRLASSYAGFKEAYAPAKGASVPLPDLPRAFQEATGDLGVLATDQERSVLSKYLGNQLSLVPEGGAEGVPAEALLAMRSNIRGAGATARQAQDFAKAQLLGGAEGEVTGALEAGLPPEALAALRAADAKYAQHKIVESAVQRSGDAPGGFTPAQLSAAIRGGAERGSYARGAGGELRQLATAGREALDTRIPLTGARLLAAPLGNVPVLNLAPAALSYAANLPGPKNFLLGQTGAQAALRSAGSAVERLMETVRLNPGALGPYAGTLAAAAKRGPQSLAATDFILAKQDPNYRQARDEALAGGGGATPPGGSP